MSRIALVGNPNTGKTSLFNILTDSYEYVGNWSGVTVEKKIGHVKKLNKEIIDLPGIYDLNPISKDESIVTTFLLEEEVDVILNIVDASHFERNIHLTIQLLELGKPVIICLNMMDVAKHNGIMINHWKLQELLNAHVQPIVARSGTGCEGIYIALSGSIKQKPNPFTLDYGHQIEGAIGQIVKLIDASSNEQKRWAAIQFLSGNKAIENAYKKEPYFSEMKRIQQSLEAEMEIDASEIIYSVRKSYIMDLKHQVIEQKQIESRLSEKLDKVLTHPFWGIPIFLGLMFLMFQATFAWIGAPLSDLLDGFIGGTFTDIVHSGLVSIGASTFIIDLICDGIIGGVGGVLVFVPQIFVLFFFISLLEDSGYMARVAVVMDRLMELCGLNGKAFIPMIISFGCNVPGVMAARTIEQPKDRMLTILVAPFMSCAARLPVYALFSGAFFVGHQSIVVFSLYLLGIVMALIITKILSLTILKNEHSIFFVELPEYHIPQLKSLWRSTWEKGKGFLRKAGTIIFAGSVIIWLLSYIGPSGVNVDMNESFLAIIGGWIGTLFTPLGFGNWQAGASLISGFMAKEVVVSTMAIIYGVSETSLPVMMSAQFTALTAYGFMAFILLYMPCLATVGAIRRETASTKWTIFAVVYPFVVAYLVTFIMYSIGSLFM